MGPVVEWIYFADSEVNIRRRLKNVKWQYSLRRSAPARPASFVTIIHVHLRQSSVSLLCLNQTRWLPRHLSTQRRRKSQRCSWKKLAVCEKRIVINMLMNCFALFRNSCSSASQGPFGSFRLENYIIEPSAEKLSFSYDHAVVSELSWAVQLRLHQMNVMPLSKVKKNQ